MMCAARARRRHRNVKALAAEVIVWPHTSFKLWYKMGSCARSEFEDNAETNVLALEVIAGLRTSLKLWCKMRSCARSGFVGNAEIRYSSPGCFLGVFTTAWRFAWFLMFSTGFALTSPWSWWFDRALLWYYDATLDHVRGQNLNAMLKFIVLALGVMAWPRTSLKLWCKIESCARSELEGGTQIQRFGRRGDSLTAHIYGIMMQNEIMCAVRVWRQCWN